MSSAPRGLTVSPPSPLDDPPTLNSTTLSPTLNNRPKSSSTTSGQAEHEISLAGLGLGIGAGVGPEGQLERNRDDPHLSPTELRAEVETLLSLRRRSISQANQVDPDLPPTAPPTAPTPRPTLSITTSSSLQVNNPPGQPDGPISPTAPAAAETGQLIRRRSTITHALPSDHPLPSPPQSPIREAAFMPTIPDGIAAAHTSQDLFWLPASLHPELAPQEFKAFIKEQTKPESLARRSSLSAAGGGIGRKKSMLRGEYKPTKDDGVGEGDDPNRLTIDGGMKGHTRLNFEELTIDDLQRLEMLAARAESEGIDGDGEGEGERLGRVLRRSLSLNPATVAQAAARQRSPSPGSAEGESHQGDSPIIVPPPGQILRRSARTKIRKSHLVGDGGGHRFGPSRRNRQGTAESVTDSIASDEADVGALDSSVESGEAGGEWLGPNASPPTSSEDHHVFVEAYNEAEVEVERESKRPLAGIFVPGPDDGADGPLPNLVQLSPTLVDYMKPVSAEDPYAQFDIDDAATGPPPLPPKVSSPPSSVGHDEEVEHYHEQQPDQAQDQPIGLPPPVAIFEQQSQITPPPERRDSIPKPQPVPADAPAPAPAHALALSPAPSPAPSPVASPISPPSPARSPVPSPPTPSSAPSSRAPSVTGSIKEKKSGWARLGLGSSSSSKEDKARKAKPDKAKEQREKAQQEQSALEQRRQAERERQKEKDDEKQREKQHQKDKAKEKEGGFLGGLFGKRKAEPQEAQPASPPPPARPQSVPPPPTASGALLPSGRYSNFYRLPIHVERAVYRLSHIKLANPRRPLYEQVLISNLMFWYLSIINNAQPPPIPTAPPVPIPGMRKKEQEGRERAGEQHSRQEGAHHSWNDRAEGEGERWSGGEQRHGYQPNTHGHGGSNQYDNSHRQFEQSSYSGTSSPTGGTRTSAPADLYAGSIISSTSEDEDDDDVPLGQRQRRSEPARPVQVREPPKQAGQGFEVTSRRKSQEEKTVEQEAQQYHHHYSGPPQPETSSVSSLSPPSDHRRLSTASINSVGSDRSSASFDEANFLDAYSVASPVGAVRILAPAPVAEEYEEAQVGRSDVGWGGTGGERQAEPAYA